MTGARPRAAQRALPRVVRRVATGLAVVAGGLAASACGGGPPIPADDLSLRVVAGATDVRLGEPFPLTVVRVWSKRLVPAAWDERALAPLAVRLTSSVRREDDLRVEETRTYRAYAFSREDVVVAPPPLVARPTDGGAERRAAAVPLALKVRPALDPASPGAPEFPDVPPPPPFPWAWGAAATVALAVVGAFLARRRARRAPEARPSDAVVGAPPPDAPAPDSVAVAALAAVEARTDADARRSRSRRSSARTWPRGSGCRRRAARAPRCSRRRSPRTTRPARRCAGSSRAATR